MNVIKRVSCLKIPFDFESSLKFSTWFIIQAKVFNHSKKSTKLIGLLLPITEKHSRALVFLVMVLLSHLLIVHYHEILPNIWQCFNVGNILLQLWLISGFIILGHPYFSCSRLVNLNFHQMWVKKSDSRATWL